MSRFLSIAVLAALLCSVVAQAGTRTLDTPVRFRDPNGGRPVAGDFNRDGKQDALSMSEHSVTFYPGKGNGTFGKGVVTATLGPAMGVADFNRDGTPDLYAAYYEAPFLVMPGLGNGTFGTPTYTPVYAPQATLITAGDFNGDTFLDLACASREASSIVVHFGDGAGGFPSEIESPLAIAGAFTALKAGDFDGDGRDDLFLLTDAESLIAWNGGSGAFFQQTAFSAHGREGAAGDINGDGVPDAVAVSSADYGSAWTEVFFGSRTRNVTTTRFPSQQYVGGVAIAQMDGTGGSDIVIGARDLTIVTHDGTNFRPSRSFAAAPSLGRVATADFDGDGKTDVLDFHSDLRSLFSFVHGNGDGTLAADLSFHDLLAIGGTGGSVPAVADINGDGRKDLVIVNSSGGFTTPTVISMGVAYGNASGGFAAPIVTAVTPDFYTGSQPKAGDINGDGRPDLIFVGFGGDPYTLRWQPFFMQSNGTFVAGPVTTTTSGTNVYITSVADINGDGRPDVLDTTGKWYAGNANGTFAAGVPIGVTLRNTVTIVDVNHDGRPDIATSGYLPNGYSSAIDCYLRNSNGTYTGPRTSNIYASIGGFADVTGDGFPEAFGFQHTVYRANGDGTFATDGFALTTLDVYLGNVPWAADFDGDGKLDVAIPGAIFYGTGQATFNDAAGMSTVAEIISTADFDGNGSPDVWMADPMSGRVVIVRTRRGATGTVPANLTLDTGTNPSRYGEGVYGKIGVAADDPVVARGAVLVQVDSGATSLYLPDATGAFQFSPHPLIPVGTSTVKVTFTGDAYYGPTTVSKTHTVDRAIPYVTLTATPAVLEKGGPVKVCAAATFYYSELTQPTGTVTLRQNGTQIGTFPAANGSCDQALNLANLPVGTYTFLAEYPGDSLYEPLTATKTVTVTRFHTTMTLTLPPGPAYEGQQVSVTASFPEDPNITGTVTFTRNGATFPVTIANGKAVLTTNFSWGSGTLSASYGGSTDFEPTSASGPLTIYWSAMNAGPVLQLTSTFAGSYYYLSFTIPIVYGASEYYIYRSVNGGPFEAWDWAGSNGKTTEYASLGYSLAYAAVARDSSGNASPMGPRVVTSTVTFADPMLTAGLTPSKALHISQLQTAVNGYRNAAGLPPATFTPVTPGTTIAAVHLTELRTALSEARSALGRPVAFTDPAITPGVTPIRTVHFIELRNGIR
jgi:hypothetical protein